MRDRSLEFELKKLRALKHGSNTGLNKFFNTHILCRCLFTVLRTILVRWMIGIQSISMAEYQTGIVVIATCFSCMNKFIYKSEELINDMAKLICMFYIFLTKILFI